MKAARVVSATVLCLLLYLDSALAYRIHVEGGFREMFAGRGILSNALPMGAADWVALAVFLLIHLGLVYLVVRPSRKRKA